MKELLTLVWLVCAIGMLVTYLLLAVDATHSLSRIADAVEKAAK